VKRFRVIYHAVLLTAVLAFSASAANWTVIRRTAQVGACVASAMDGFSTAAAVQAGAGEANPLLRSQSGGVNYGRLITLKSLTCVVPIVVSETMRRRHPERMEYMGALGSTALAGFYSWAAVHNYGVVNQMKQAGAVPAYLK
jgi:hypothetical protein